MRLYWCMEKILKNPVLMYNGRDAYYLCRNYLGTSYKNAKGGQRRKVTEKREQTSVNFLKKEAMYQYGSDIFN